MTGSRFNIKLYTNPSGGKVYRVEGTKLNGQRVCRNFKDPAVAEAYQQQLENEHLGLEVQYHLQQTSLSEHQLQQAEGAFRTAPDVDRREGMALRTARWESTCPDEFKRTSPLAQSWLGTSSVA